MLEKVKETLSRCSGKNSCKECQYYEYSAECLSQLHKDAFETINNMSEDDIKDFSHFLIDSAVDGVIKVDDIPDLVIQFTEEKVLSQLKLDKSIPPIWRPHYPLEWSDYQDGWTCSHCGKYSIIKKEMCDGCGGIMSNASVCLTGYNPHGFCSCCRADGQKCCLGCKDKDSCNIVCGWLPEPKVVSIKKI